MRSDMWEEKVTAQYVETEFPKHGWGGVSLDTLDSGRDAEGLRQLEEALRRGCAACYAAEGIYPQDLEYLEEHYGVQVDGDRYVVHYEIFAQNLMPDITVLENKP